MAVDPIINDLQYMMETGQELDILNFFKGFPITCKASVVQIDRDVVDIIAQPPGCICLKAQTETILLCKGLPEAVRAQVISFDLPSGQLRLRDFLYADSHFGDRKITRVEPDDELAVEILSEDKVFPGVLVDVSLSGVGIIMEQDTLKRGQILQITIPLPEQKIDLPGKVLGISESISGKDRYSIGFTRNAHEIAIIMRYIRDRRVEILEEIQRLYSEQISSNGVG